MQFYEEHIEHLYLRELIRLWSPYILRAVIIWFFIKIRLAQLKPPISAQKGQIRERIIEFDDIPQHAQPVLVSIMNQLKEHGFVDSLIESQLHGSRIDNLKMIGARVLARHKSGRCVASMMIIFDEESSCQRVVLIHTFIDSVTTISTTNSRRVYNETPGNFVTYHPEISFEDLIDIHQQTVAKRGDSYTSIHQQDEMITYAQGLVDRSVDHLVQRGFLVKTEPDELDLPLFIDYENEKETNKKGPHSLIQFLIFLFTTLVVLIYMLLK